MDHQNPEKTAGTTRGSDDNGATTESDRMKEDAKAKAAEVKEGARAMARDTKAAVKETVEDVRMGAEDRVDRWSGSMGRRVEHLAGALRAASDSLHDQGEKGLAGVADDAARHVNRVSGYLEEEDSRSMMADLTERGRRHPGAFLGGAFVLGLAAGRFLRASAPDDKSSASGREDASRTTTSRSTRVPGGTAHLAESPPTMMNSGLTEGRTS